MKTAFPILLLAIAEPAKALALSGVVCRLRQEIPNARITLVTTRLSAELFQDDDLVDELQAIDGAIFQLKTLGVLTDLSRRSWGLCVDIGPTMISRLIPAKTRFTLNANDPAGPLTQLCRALRLDEAEVAPSLRVSPARQAGVRTFLDNGRGIAPLIVMAPGAGWLGRRWPTERFAVLATRLMRNDGPFAGHSLLILGSQDDYETAVALRMATPRARVLELTGKLDLLSAYAALRHGSVFVGNDEIWLHLAAASGIETFALMGPSDDAVAPIGDNVHIIRGPRSFSAIQAADPKLKLDICHMLDLSIDTVYDGIVRVTESNGRARKAAAEAVAE
ncbi:MULTISPECIES: glycosyltransferase family 9 protein [Asticcacaulis]|uniref:glycosyltransferase family 9 protein n=1 Tax=Asticcacaulis TaxID=76890 RepID=UPI001AE5E414|nr:MULTISPECIES: glycosyltransferase family 9 protein [Asticcacaulis]MBP2158663.1 ADP-heptose:LPS heptosyltransferase [Asticcacaulis solisilvae]MDR6799709.1 ADP-heptose:LPS heptosyltransferase [Asticcacaulis sp. BE141]